PGAQAPPCTGRPGRASAGRRHGPARARSWPGRLGASGDDELLDVTAGGPAEREDDRVADICGVAEAGVGPGLVLRRPPVEERGVHATGRQHGDRDPALELFGERPAEADDAPLAGAVRRGVT